MGIDLPYVTKGLNSKWEMEFFFLWVSIVLLRKALLSSLNIVSFLFVFVFVEYVCLISMPFFGDGLLPPNDIFFQLPNLPSLCRCSTSVI